MSTVSSHPKPRQAAPNLKCPSVAWHVVAESSMAITREACRDRRRDQLTDNGRWLLKALAAVGIGLRPPYVPPPAAAAAKLSDRELAVLEGMSHGKSNADIGVDLFILIIDAQDVLITLATPADAEPTRDAVTYWEVAETPPTGDDPLDALIVRLAAAYQEPWLLKFHLDDVGSAAGRGAELVDPELRVSTRDEVFIVGDYLSAYVLEWTLHHLDLIAHLSGAAQPPAESLARSREMLEKIAGAAFPASLPDRSALLVGTGRRAPTDAETAELGELAAKLPLVLG